MAKTKVQKQGHVEELDRLLGSAKGVVFANYQGLTMADSDALRKECRAKGITMIASKKTLVQRLLTNAGFQVNAKGFQGSVAAFFGAEDEIAPAQVVATFAKTHNKVTIFGGIFEGTFIDESKVKALSTIPSREQLLGQLVGTLNAPVSGFVNVLAGNIRGLVTVLNAVKEKQA